MKKGAILTIICLISLFSYGQDWSTYETSKMVAQDRSAGDRFGHRVAISGDHSIVSTPFQDTDADGQNAAENAGAAYIYERDENGIWVLSNKLVASDRTQNDAFGTACMIYGDIAVVGAWTEGEDENQQNTLNNAGSVYVFIRNNDGNWVESQKLTPSDRSISDFFGGSVSISSDHIVIGATGEDHDESGQDAVSNAGSVYVFSRDGNGNWVETQKLVASDRGEDDFFGAETSISGDFIFVSAAQEDEDDNGQNFKPNSGSVYVFKKNSLGTWVQTQKLVASDRSNQDLFGTSVSVNNRYAVIGASGETEDESGQNTLRFAGSAYVFERDDQDHWVEVQKLVPSDREANDVFAQSVRVKGRRIVIGSTFEDQDETGGNFIEGAGSVYVFERDAAGDWLEVVKLVAPDRKTREANFGRSVDFNGNTIITGAPGESFDLVGANLQNSSGAVYWIVNPALLSQGALVKDDFWHIYPNPAYEHLTLTLETVVNERTITIDVLTLNGESVLHTQQDPVDTSYSLRLSDLDPGIYVVRIHTSNQIVSRRVVKL